MAITSELSLVEKGSQIHVSFLELLQSTMLF